MDSCDFNGVGQEALQVSCEAAQAARASADAAAKLTETVTAAAEKVANSQKMLVHWTEFFEALSSLAVPAIVIALVVLLYKPIKELMGSRLLKSMSISLGGNSISIEKIAESTNDLLNDLQDEVIRLTLAMDQYHRGGGNASVPPEVLEAIRRTHIDILWVDDKPDGIAHEIRIFDEINVSTTHVTSTAAAKGELRGSAQYRAIITDMSRGGNSKAGITLVKWIRREAAVKDRLKDSICLIYTRLAPGEDYTGDLEDIHKVALKTSFVDLRMAIYAVQAQEAARKAAEKAADAAIELAGETDEEKAAREAKLLELQNFAGEVARIANALKAAADGGVLRA